MSFRAYLKTLPEHRQKKIARGERLLKYIVKQRCQHPEMLGDAAGDGQVSGRAGAGAASPKVRGVAGK